MTMTKHSRFSIFYEKIPRAERTLALQTLLVLFIIYAENFVYCCVEWCAFADYDVAFGKNVDAIIKFSRKGRNINSAS